MRTAQVLAAAALLGIILVAPAEAALRKPDAFQVRPQQVEESWGRDLRKRAELSVACCARLAFQKAHEKHVELLEWRQGRSAAQPSAAAKHPAPPLTQGCANFTAIKDPELQAAVGLIRSE